MEHQFFDIKPYIPYSDCHPEAEGSFASVHQNDRIKVDIPEELERLVPEEKRPALYAILEQDPRPAYQQDPERIYGFPFAWNGNPLQGKGRLSDSL